MERIVRAACLYRGAVFSVPQPGRHHNIFHEAAKHGWKAGEEDEQGFLTDTGRFVDRVEGLALAVAAGQIIEKCGSPNILFSEDMW